MPAAAWYQDLFEDIGAFIEAIDDTRDGAVGGGSAHPDFVALLANIQTVLAANSTLHIQDSLEGNVDSMRTTLSSYCQSFAQRIDSRLVDRDTVLTELPSVVNETPLGVLFELYRAMINDSESINASVVSLGTPAAEASNNGSGTVHLTKVLDGFSPPHPGLPINREYKSLDSELVVPSDVLSVTCTADEDNTGLSEGMELFRIEGQPALASPFDWQTEGSGAYDQLATVNAFELIANRDLEAWSDNTPTNFTTISGVAGTDFAQEAVSGNVHRGSSSLQLIGGGTDVILTQEIPVGALNPDRLYFLSAFVKTDSASAGTLTLQLESPSGGYTPGGSETISYALTGVGTTAYTHQFCWAMMPATLPDDMRFKIAYESGGSGDTVWLDSIAFAPVVYVAGVGWAIVAGATQFAIGDRFAITNTNVEGIIQRFLRRWYQVQLPSSGTPTIADSLAT